MNNSLHSSLEAPRSRNRSASLVHFLEICTRDLDLQQRLRQTASLHDFVAACEAAGHALKVRELQLWAHCEDFDAPWFPWAGLDRQVRANFFRGN